MSADEGRVATCRYCGHDTENTDAVCGPCRTTTGRVASCTCNAKGLPFPHQHATLCPVFYEGVKGRETTPDDAYCFHCGKRLSHPDESHDDHASAGRVTSPCEVITGHFAWFSSRCGMGTTSSVPCSDPYCDDLPHRHAVCALHLTAPARTEP